MSQAGCLSSRIDAERVLPRLLFAMAVALVAHALFFKWGSSWFLSSPTEREFVRSGIELSLLELSLENISPGAVLLSDVPEASAEKNPPTSKPLSLPEKITAPPEAKALAASKPELISPAVDKPEQVIPLSGEQVLEALDKSEKTDVTQSALASPLDNHNSKAMALGSAGESPASPVADSRETPAVADEISIAKPLYRENPPPYYPPAARRRHLEGTVLVEVLVNRQGGADEVRLAQSSGHRLLDQAAINGVKDWRFEPARQAGQAIAMWVQVPVRFALR